MSKDKTKNLSHFDYLEQCSNQEILNLYNLLHQHWYLKIVIKQKELNESNYIKNFQFS